MRRCAVAWWWHAGDSPPNNDEVVMLHAHPIQWPPCLVASKPGGVQTVMSCLTRPGVLSRHLLNKPAEQVT